MKIILCLSLLATSSFGAGTCSAICKTSLITGKSHWVVKDGGPNCCDMIGNPCKLLNAGQGKKCSPGGVSAFAGGTPCKATAKYCSDVVANAGTSSGSSATQSSEPPAHGEAE